MTVSDKLLRGFFNEIHNSNINYVVWKNTNLIENFFLGQENLDIYVDNYNYNHFKKILQKHQWIKMLNNIRNYNFIDHYFLFTKDRTYHLHIYNKIITGDSILKEYDFTNFVNIDDKFFSKKYHLWILDLNTQFILFNLRFLIKTTNLLGNYIYNKQKYLYVEEFLFLKESIDNNNSLLLKFKKNFFLNMEIDNKLSKFDNQTSKKILNNISQYKFKNFFEIYFIYLNFFVKLFLKKIFNKKNFKLQKGLAFFISGCDASGKSTLVNNIGDIYKTFIDVKIYSIAKPYPNFIINFAKKRKINEKKMEVEHKIIKKPKANLLTAIKNVNLAFLRYLTYRKILKALNQKYLIICDRYVSNNFSEINGPRITQDSKNILINFFKFCELFFYNRIKPLEFEIRLITNLDVAIIRNKQRLKSLYKKEEEIIRRYHLFEKSKFKSLYKYLYENDKQLHKSIEDILLITNKMIISKTNDNY